LSPTEPRQLQWLNDNTKVVTLTVGGNNAHFGDVMLYCALRALTQASCKSTWAGAVNSAIRNLGLPGGHDNYPDLFTAIKEAAPRAKIYVLGYPAFFPPNIATTCPTGAGHLFTSGDMHWINSEITSLNTLIAQTAKSKGLTYVSTYSAFSGHYLCDATPYFNSAILSASKRSGSFHPKVIGQAKLASIVEAAIAKG
jgi:hypothetical protein